jgi:hypothetical protein
MTIIITGTLHEDVFKFILLLRTRNVFNKTRRKNQNTFFSENHAVYEKRWKNLVKGRELTNDNTIWRKGVAHRIKIEELLSISVISVVLVVFIPWNTLQMVTEVTETCRC